jgi:PASTA domain-containing protein
VGAAANDPRVKTFGFLLASALALAPAAAAKPPAPQPQPQAAIRSGNITICATQGAWPATGPLAFTLAAPASEGGTQVISVALGACSPVIWYPSGTSLSILETVPAGHAVTAIAFAGSGALTASTPSAGSATVSIGTSSGTVTFTTSGPKPASTAAPCRVPGLFGLTVTGAKARLKAHACALGRVRRVYSKVIRAGYVLAQSPKKGATLAHGAPVGISVSRGPLG